MQSGLRDPSEQTEKRMLALSVALAAGIFALDLVLPLGVAAGVPYVALVILALWSPRPHDIVRAAIVGSVLTIIGFAFSPAGGTLWVVLFNRGLALFVIWIAATLGLRRKQVESALRESQLKYRAIFDNSVEGILVADIETHRISFGNRVIRDMLNYSDKELAGLVLEDVFSAQKGKIEDFEALLEPSLKADRTHSCVVCQRRDDSTLKAEIHVTTIPIDGREYKVFFVHDISIRMEAEIARNRYMSAIEQAGEAVIITDAAARIQFVNPAWERQTGLSRPEWLGQNPRIVHSGQHEAAYYEDMWDCLTAGKTWTGRLVNRDKSGDLYTTIASISPVVDASGETVNYVGVMRDITKEIAVEEQLRQSQKLEAIGLLAGGVAHDFNNILQAIRGYSDLAIACLPSTHEARECIEHISVSGDRAAALVRQLLAFSRHQVLEAQDINVNEVVGNVVSMIRCLIGEDISLKIIQCRSPRLVHADPNQLQQILVNLCVNSRDAMPQGGTITIQTKTIQVAEAQCQPHAWTKPGDYLLLSISDTGCGMDEDTLASAFDPFFTTKPVGEGTGLGLSMVYGLVRQHRGFIEATSQVAHGTNICIYLPLVNASSTADPTHIQEAAGGR